MVLLHDSLLFSLYSSTLWSLRVYNPYVCSLFFVFLKLHTEMATSKADGKRRLMGMEEEEDQEEDEDTTTGDDEKKRRGKRGYSGGSTLPYCQAEDCTADMTNAKHYHRRHKVCEFHAKAPVVRVAGIHQRFCQQCSRFHELSEFDENKRSCRRRLAGHNERRRKSSSEYHGEGSNY